MKVFGEVAPYYFTWMLLAMYRIDRIASYNYLIIIIVLVAGFEMQVRSKFGTGNYAFLFNMLYSYFPDSFTIGESLKLTRQLFPLLFQMILVFCDATIDAPKVKTQEEEETQKKEMEYVKNFAAAQEELLAKLNAIDEKQDKIADSEIEELYKEVRVFDQKDIQSLCRYRDKETFRA